jgi:RNA polymerase sigma-70 factor (ECF subfamily)
MNDVPKAIETVWKIESTRLIAAIARVTNDIGIAEELAKDALVTASRTLARRRHSQKIPARG